MNGEVLSATGGGMADSVEWDNVLSKPNLLQLLQVVHIMI